MKTLRSLILWLGLLALAAGLCAKDFEGKIRFKMTPPGAPAKTAGGDSSIYMNYCLKAGLVRMDTEPAPGKVMSMIVDTVKQEMTILMPEQKMYMVRKMSAPQNTAGTATPVNDVDFVRTGETTAILGYKCEKILIKGKEGETEVWAAEGLGAFQGMGNRNPMGRQAPKSAWEAALAQHGFFPLRTVTRDKSGKELMRLEAVSIDPQSLADSVFAPPADYQKIEMPSIPGLGGMNPFGRKSD